MTAAEPLRRRLTLLAAALPAAAAAQPFGPPEGPPGGESSAWPLGLIVAMVALMFALGALVERRRRRSSGRGGPPAGP